MEEEDEDDVSKKDFCDILSFTTLRHKHYKSIMSKVERNCTQFQCVLSYSLSCHDTIFLCMITNCNIFYYRMQVFRFNKLFLVQQQVSRAQVTSKEKPSIKEFTISDVFSKV